MTQHSQVTAQNLSQEAYRLLRTVQSFLNTSEPNLAQNTSLSDTCFENQRTPSRNDSFTRLSPDADSLQRSMQDVSLSRISPHITPVENLDSRNYSATVAEGSFSSLRREHSRRHVPLHSTLTVPRDSHLDFELESPGGHLVVPHYTASLGRPKKLDSKLVVSRAECYVSDTPSEKQLSLSSNEDESGFSSMSSFQEVGLPPVPTSSTPSPEDVPSYPQVGVPVFETGDFCANHRRWNSVPVDTHVHSQLAPVIPESVTVMWV
ncbi:hypothetical protein PR048_000012 [Dryococelus australis]|uniref:Uncharacterized protein n=1 Tax=Dryococelus australis TaxID=614101 RepID=A0ABQ9IDG5_9NEOP|nr:hypothetical protein PR048_000012 [Dryococelus australis]